MNDAAAFREARDFLLAHRERRAEAYARFRWPRLTRFNWALDHFDPMARGNHRAANAHSAGKLMNMRRSPSASHAKNVRIRPVASLADSSGR